MIVENVIKILKIKVIFLLISGNSNFLIFIFNPYGVGESGISFAINMKLLTE